MYCKSESKYKKKRHKAFNIKINNNTVFFFLDLEDKKKINDEITALFKKTVSKILKFKWVADLKFFSYITD